MYPPRAYSLVREAIKEAGSTETWEVLKALCSVTKRKYGKKFPSADLEDCLKIHYVSDLEDIINFIKNEDNLEGRTKDDFLPRP